MWKLLFSIAAFWIQPCAAVRFTNTNWDVQPGKSFKVTWSNDFIATVSIFVYKAEVSELVAGVVSGTVDTETLWSVPLSLPLGLYRLKITDGSGVDNFSPNFSLGPASTTRTASPTDTTSTSSSRTATPPAGSDPSSNPSPAGGGDGSGLDPGAKAGIGVGAGIGGIALLAAVACVFYRRGKSASGQKQVLGNAGAAQPGTAELGGQPKPGAELSATAEPKLVPELGTSQGTKHAQELPTEPRRVPELGGAGIVGREGQSRGNAVPELHGGLRAYNYPTHAAELGADANHR